MDSLNRIFASINEAKKKKKGMVGPTPKGKANRYDHDSFGMQKEAHEYPGMPFHQGEHDYAETQKENRRQARLKALKGVKKKPLSPKQRKIAGMAGNPNKIDAADLAKLRKRGKKVNASTEIAAILNIIKEAYEDDLISEEAFLTIADPVVKLLSEGKKYVVKDPRTGRKIVVDADNVHPERRTNKRNYIRKDDRRTEKEDD